MKRGDIYFIQLDPTVGQETQKKRPGLVVSNNSANNAATKGGAKIITVVPLISNTRKVFPFEVFLSASQTGLPKDSKAMCNQVRVVSTNRIASKKVGFVKLMDDVDQALRIHFSLM